MQFAHLPTTRLHVLTASMEMLLGLCIYVYPGAFHTPGYSVVGSYFPLISAALVSSGVLLLIRDQHPLPPLVRRLAGILPAIPLIGFAVVAAKSGGWTAAVCYGVTALALLLGPRLSRRPSADLWYLAFGVIQALTAATFLVGPRLYTVPAYVPLFPFMRPLGAVGLVGAGLLIYNGWPGPRPLPARVMRFASSVMPVIITWSFWVTDYYTGVVFWGTWVVGLLLGVGDPRPAGARPGVLDGDQWDTFPGNLERMLESWMWLLALSVVLMTVATHEASASASIRLTVFVLAVSGYNAVAFRGLRGSGSLRIRLRSHLSFLAVSVALLLLHGSRVGHGFLALLGTLPPLAARAMGMREGYRLLSVAGVAVLVSALLGDVSHSAAEILVDLVLLAVASSVGLQVASEQRRTEAEKARLAAILEATPDLVAISETDGRLVYMNQAGRRLLGLRDTELPPGAVTLEQAPALADGVWTGEGTIQSRTGEAIPVSKVVIAHRESDGQVRHYSTIQRDIRSQKQVEWRLRNSEERFRQAFEGAPIGMALLNSNLDLIQVNEALCTMLGYTPAELHLLGVKGVTHPDDYRGSVPSGFQPGRGSSYSQEKRYIHKDGRTVWTLVSVSQTVASAGRSDLFIAHVQDITERKSYEKQLMHLASYDPLTDLFNRRRFQEELERQLLLVMRRGGRGALMFIDLDQFKYVNDTLGHQAGDEFLRSVATILRHQLRRGADTVARLGGDEFAVILPDVTGPQACEAADRILGKLRQHVLVLAGQSISGTASIGIALFPEHGTCAADLLARADFAMYQAKDGGRNRHYCFQPDSDAVGQASIKLRWEQRIRQALEADRMMLFSQPIWSLRENRTSHYELLLRMQGEHGEIIAPGEFLPVAERFGLIHAIDRWVVRQAIRIIAGEAQLGRRLVVEVNLSGLAFADSDLLPLIRSELAETGIDSSCLILEITETAAIADLDQARRFVATLRDLGCRFAIDDFGSGFASFAYLKHLPVDYLKIDGSFIENLIRDPVDQHLVKGMVEVARGLGKQTIAEFVGDYETLQMLRSFGVDYAQGYYIGRPVPRTQDSFAE
ncbi:MAG TPA: EAL domain-containing protein [Symbiobacteriaceae bacterium]|nr:EAL domain-containing protein [Symbiobacteriaceae bacterium]